MVARTGQPVALLIPRRVQLQLRQLGLSSDGAQLGLEQLLAQCFQVGQLSSSVVVNSKSWMNFSSLSETAFSSDEIARSTFGSSIAFLAVFACL